MIVFSTDTEVLYLILEQSVIVGVSCFCEKVIFCMYLMYVECNQKRKKEIFKYLMCLNE